MFAGNICQRSHWISVYNSPQEHKYISSHEHKYNSLGEHKYKYLQLLHHHQYHKIANIGLISYELKSSIHIILIFIALPISILSCFIITQYTMLIGRCHLWVFSVNCWSQLMHWHIRDGLGEIEEKTFLRPSENWEPCLLHSWCKSLSKQGQKNLDNRYHGSTSESIFLCKTYNRPGGDQFKLLWIGNRDAIHWIAA